MEEQRGTLVLRAERSIVEDGIAEHEADLRQGLTGPDADRERAWDDLEEQRAGVAGGGDLEAATPIREQSGEEVEASRGRLGVRADLVGQRRRHLLEERQHVGVSALEDRSVGQVEPVERLVVEEVGDRPSLGEESAPHPVAHGCEPQVEARGLDLVGGDARVARQGPGTDQFDDALMGQDPSFHPGRG